MLDKVHQVIELMTKQLPIPFQALVKNYLLMHLISINEAQITEFLLSIKRLIDYILYKDYQENIEEILNERVN